MFDETSKNLDVYLYGMTVFSTIHLLDGPYPQEDTYREIKETYMIPGGETFNAALVLSKFGLGTRIDGPWLGKRSKEGILDFCGRYGIDCSGMHFEHDFEGVQDLVLVSGNSRTIFGKFARYFSTGVKWTAPDLSAVRSARIVSIDPFFGEESIKAALYCRDEGKSYVTIDCRPDSEIFRNAAAAVISNEYMKSECQGEENGSIFQRYLEASGGLVIFTFGSREIVYGRRGGELKRLQPYRVEVRSTLGAGDTFRAGVVYGVLQGWSDDEIVRFAAATAASVCRRFPMALDPPGLEEVKALAGIKG